MKKTQVKVPQDYKYVRTYDDHCYEIVEAYVCPSFPPNTILVSKEGTRIDYANVTEHSNSLLDVIDMTYCYSETNEWVPFVWLMKNAVAIFGRCDLMVVAEVDSRGDLHLLPEKEQLMVGVFEVTEKHRKTYEKYKKKLEENE